MPTGTLPASGKAVWERVYKDALNGSCKKNKECAVKTAWKAVENAGWRKVDGKWVKKSDAIAEMSMYITKATQDGKVMRWAATNSDTDPDSYQERMSLELYNDFIRRMKEDIPEVFRSIACSDYWCGGTPYLSISHYPDLNGGAVPGEVLDLFIDGNKLKAKGILYNSPLGHSVFRSLLEDKNKNPEDRIRISIGFIDLAHKHGDNGKLWVRENLTSICPDCLNGVGDKVYVKGYLVHLALTRVPVNKRTEMVLEEKSMATKDKKTTRKEDAESIVGKTLAEEIDMKNQVQTLRADAMIEMSEGENPTPEETAELIAEAEANPELPAESVDETPAETPSESPDEDEEDMDEWKDSESLADEEDVSEEDALEALSLAEKGYGGYLVSDNGEGKPALPTKKDGKLSHRLMGAAWAALHGGYRGNKYGGKGKEQAVAKLKRLYKKEGIPLPSEKSETEDKSDMMMNLPYGGATSMKDADKHRKAQEEMSHVMDLWSMFSNVAWNIMDNPEITEKKSAFMKALDEFKSMLAAKAMVEFSQAQPATVEKSVVNENPHELKPALDVLLTAIDNSITFEGDVSAKLQTINPVLQEFGQAITDYVTAKSAKANEPPAQNKDNNTLLEDIKKLIQPISDSVQALQGEVGVLKAQASVQSVQIKSRIPAPRSVRIEPKPPTATSEDKPKPGSIKDIARKSVGLIE